MNKVKVIRLDRLNDLIRDYKQMKDKGETFEDFVLVSGCINDDTNIKVFDWEEVDEINLKEVENE